MADVGHTDSMESHDDASKQNEKKKSRRPASTSTNSQDPSNHC